MILIPSRFRIGLLGMSACSLLYTLRVNLSVAIVAMVQTKTDETHPDDWCPEYMQNQTTTEDSPSGPFDWSESIQGIILGAYFYGFTATQIMGGIITDRWGAKWVCAAGITIPAIVNALSPLAAEQSYIYLIVIRVIIGGFHGLVHSSLFSMYAKWFPHQERTIAIAATQFGGNIGAVVMSPLAGYLCKYGYAGGWPSVFYTSSAVHVIWLIIWLYFGHNSPNDDPRINPEEHLYILQNISSNITKKIKPSVPWKAILTSRPVYASIFAKTSGTFGYYVLATSVPTYLYTIFDVKLEMSSLYTALMYLAVGITVMSAGPLSAFIIAKTKISRTRVRKIFQFIALTGPAICLVIVPSLECNFVAVIILIILSMLLYGFITGGEYPIIPEYAPEFTGTVFGFTNTFASSMGFVAPIIVGVILDSNVIIFPEKGTRYKWNLVFYITAAFYFLGALLFELFGSSERQPWSKITLPTNDIEMSTFSTNKMDKNKNNSKERKQKVFSRFRKPEKIDTQTPEWLQFKKSTFVY